MNPNVEKKKVRPYLSFGLRIGTDSAFRFTGFTAGAFQRTLIPMSVFSFFRKVGMNASSWLVEMALVEANFLAS